MTVEELELREARPWYGRRELVLGPNFFMTLLNTMTSHYLSLVAGGRSTREARAIVAQILWDNVESLCLIARGLKERISQLLLEVLREEFPELKYDPAELRPPRLDQKLVAVFRRRENLHALFRRQVKDAVQMEEEATQEALRVLLTVAQAVLMEAMGLTRPYARGAERWWRRAS